MGAEELWACSGRRTRQVHCSVADFFFLGRPSLQRRRRIGNRKEDSLREGERERRKERERETVFLTSLQRRRRICKREETQTGTV